MPELVANLPILAAKCMAVKGLRYKPTWEVWDPTYVGSMSMRDVFVQKIAETFFSVFLVFRAKINCRVFFKANMTWF